MYRSTHGVPSLLALQHICKIERKKNIHVGRYIKTIQYYPHSKLFFLYREVGCNVPLGDWRTSLCVWIELCARRAELPALLKAADVLVTLPPRQKRQPDNRYEINCSKDETASILYCTLWLANCLPSGGNLQYYFSHIPV